MEEKDQVDLKRTKVEVTGNDVETKIEDVKYVRIDEKKPIIAINQTEDTNKEKDVKKENRKQVKTDENEPMNTINSTEDPKYGDEKPDIKNKPAKKDVNEQVNMEVKDEIEIIDLSGEPEVEEIKPVKKTRKRAVPGPPTRHAPERRAKQVKIEDETKNENKIKKENELKPKELRKKEKKVKGKVAKNENRMKKEKKHEAEELPNQKIKQDKAKDEKPTKNSKKQKTKIEKKVTFNPKVTKDEDDEELPDIKIGVERIKEFQSIFQVALKANARIKDVAYAMRLYGYIKQLDFRVCDEEFLFTLQRCFFSKNFYRAEKNKKFLSNLVKKFVPISQKLGLFVCCKLPEINSDRANEIGEVFLNAWAQLNSTERSAYEYGILKNVIRCSICGSTPQLSKNSRAFMEAFHEKRRKKDLCTALAHMYEPLAFRYLHSANVEVRENAFLVLMAACPLQSPQFTAEKNLRFIQQFVEEFKSGLSDESSRVRAVAAKSVCRVLYEWYDLFSGFKAQFINFIATKSVFDLSSPDVRIAAIEGLIFLLSRAECIEIIKAKVKDMVSLLYDPNEKVRLQFIKFIHATVNLENINIFEFIHIDHFIFKMINDSDEVVSMICQILHPSIFPSIKKASKHKLTNTKRVARCVYLTSKSITAAKRFYSFLPQFASDDEILDFLQFAFTWSEKCALGKKKTEIPDVSIKGSETQVLREIDNIEPNIFKPHQAIWAIIASSVSEIARRIKKEEELAKIKGKYFQSFDAKRLVNELPPELHPELFQFISNFKATDDEIELALSYLHDGSQDAWIYGMRCLVKWNSIGEYFTKLVEMFSAAASENGIIEKSEDLNKCIGYLSFIFSNRELRESILKEVDAIEELSIALNQFVQYVLIKLEIPFEGVDQMNPQVIETAKQISDDTYVLAIGLFVTLRVHLSIQVLQEEDEQKFHEFVDVMEKALFTPIIQGTLTTYSAESITRDSLAFMILEKIMGLVADMVSIHVFDGDIYQKIIATYRDAIDIENHYNDDFKIMAFSCVSKIIVNNVVDSDLDEDKDHPIKSLLKTMICSTDSKRTFFIVKGVIEKLVRVQTKKKTISWLSDVFSDILFNENDEPEENQNDENKEEEEEEDISKKIAREVKNLLNQSIVKL